VGRRRGELPDGGDEVVAPLVVTGGVVGRVAWDCFACKIQTTDRTEFLGDRKHEPATGPVSI